MSNLRDICMFIILSFYKDLKFFYVYVYLSICMRITYLLAPKEGTRGCWMPWNWRYGSECTNMGPLQQTRVLLLATECNRESC